MKIRFMKSLNEKSNNKGMSLVELIVTLLISSMVMLAAVYLFQISSKGYTVSTFEQNLQIEAQTASAVTEELVLEALDYEYVSGSVPALIVLVNSETANKKDTVVVLYDSATKRIILHRYKEDDRVTGKSQFELSTLAGETLAAYPNDFLAKYVDMFNVSPNSMDEASAGNKLVKIELLFKLEGSIKNEFVKNINISLRNKK